MSIDRSCLRNSVAARRLRVSPPTQRPVRKTGVEDDLEDTRYVWLAVSTSDGDRVAMMLGNLSSDSLDDVVTARTLLPLHVPEDLMFDIWVSGGDLVEVPDPGNPESLVGIGWVMIGPRCDAAEAVAGAQRVLKGAASPP